MRFLSVILLMGLAVVGGCGKSQSNGNTTKKKPAGVVGTTNDVSNPSFSAIGKIVSANATARFVVISYPLTTIPREGQRLNVYRSGLKVGEVKVTGLRQESNIVADIVAGDAQTGDDVHMD
jgi:hypothetical protein